MIPNEAALRQAMERLLAGNPRHHRGPVCKADGSVHISGWAVEAGLGATVPYRFKGLITEFQRELDNTEHRAEGRYEARLARLQDELVAEGDRARRYRAERDAARAEANRLASVVALLDREAEIARSERTDIVRPLRRPTMKEAR